MTTRHRPCDDDRRLFRSAVGTVRPLSNDRVEPLTPVRPGRAVHRPRPSEPVSEQGLSDRVAGPTLGPGDVSWFARGGLRHKELRQLKRGRIPTDAMLDLHGMTLAEARTALAGFLQHCQDEQVRCVRIVHGKGHRSATGQAVLKTQTDHWLRTRPEVLAFCTAQSADGGTGAVYVLLKR